MRSILLIISGFWCLPAMAQAVFESQPLLDAHPPQTSSDTFYSVKPVMCDGVKYGIVFSQGANQHTEPLFEGLCKWEKRDNIDACIAESTSENRRCLNKAIAQYGQLDRRASVQQGIPDLRNDDPGATAGR